MTHYENTQQRQTTHYANTQQRQIMNTWTSSWQRQMTLRHTKAKETLGNHIPKYMKLRETCFKSKWHSGKPPSKNIWHSEQTRYSNIDMTLCARTLQKIWHPEWTRCKDKWHSGQACFNKTTEPIVRNIMTVNIADIKIKQQWI